MGTINVNLLKYLRVLSVWFISYATRSLFHACLCNCERLLAKGCCWLCAGLPVSVFLAQVYLCLVQVAQAFHIGRLAAPPDLVGGFAAASERCVFMSFVGK